MTDLADLARRFAAVPGVSFKDCERFGGPVVVLSNPGGTAVVALKGAQVLSWVPAGRDDVLWVSPIAQLDMERAMRGGIPVCWPWFAEHPTDKNQPFHGVVRTAAWVPAEITATAAATRALFALVDETLAAPLRPRLLVSVGATLRLELETTNTGPEEAKLTEALHTYFAVSEASGVTVEGLDGTTYLDKVDQFARKRQDGPVHFAGETDRIYLSGGRSTWIVDKGLGRRIAISSQGSGAAVVWNAGPERAARMPDIPGDSWRRYVCVETANAADASVTIPGGGRHVMVAEINLIDEGA